MVKEDGKHKSKPEVLSWSENIPLTHFSTMFHFYTPSKSQKTTGFQTVSKGIGMEHQAKLD